MHVCNRSQTACNRIICLFLSMLPMDRVHIRWVSIISTWTPIVTIISANFSKLVQKCEEKLGCYKKCTWLHGSVCIHGFRQACVSCAKSAPSPRKLTLPPKETNETFLDFQCVLWVRAQLTHLSFHCAAKHCLGILHHACKQNAELMSQQALQSRANTR